MPVHGVLLGEAEINLRAISRVHIVEATSAGVLSPEVRLRRIVQAAEARAGFPRNPPDQRRGLPPESAFSRLRAAGPRLSLDTPSVLRESWDGSKEEINRHTYWTPHTRQFSNRTVGGRRASAHLRVKYEQMMLCGLAPQD